VPLQGPNSRLFCAERTPKRGLPYCETHMCYAYQRAPLRKGSLLAPLARLALELLPSVQQRLGTFKVFGKSKP
jgi:hypothetical protein